MSCNTALHKLKFHMTQPPDKMSSLLPLEMLTEAFMLATINIKTANDRQPSKVTNKIPEFNV